jgi:hypothetical protein
MDNLQAMPYCALACEFYHSCHTMPENALVRDMRRFLCSNEACRFLPVAASAVNRGT